MKNKNYAVWFIPLILAPLYIVAGVGIINSPQPQGSEFNTQPAEQKQDENCDEHEEKCVNCGKNNF